MVVDARIAEALALPTRLERLIEVAAIVAEAIAPTRLVVVGGLAVSFGTAAQEPTDIDVRIPDTRELRERLGRLGFDRPIGSRHWTVAGGAVAVEAPAAAPADGEAAVEIASPLGRTAWVLSPAALVGWRLVEFVATGHSELAEHIVGLMRAPRFDSGQFESALHRHGLDGISGHLTALVSSWCDEGVPSSDHLMTQARQAERLLLRSRR